MPETPAAPTTTPAPVPAATTQTPPAAAAPAAAPEAKPAEAAPAALKPDDSASAREVEKTKLLRERSTLQKEKAALEAEKKAIEARKAELDALSKANPLEALKKLGRTPEEIAQLLINGGKPVEEDPQAKTIRELREKIASLEQSTTKLEDARTADEKKAAEAQEKASRDALVADLREHAADAAPTVLTFGRVDDVIAEARRLHEETGEIDWVAAAKAAEVKVRKEFESLVDKVLENQHLRAHVEAKMKPVQPPAPAEPAKTETPAAATTTATEAPAAETDRFAHLREPRYKAGTVTSKSQPEKHAPRHSTSFDQWYREREAKRAAKT